jgi:hypothetical protein
MFVVGDSSIGCAGIGGATSAEGHSDDIVTTPCEEESSDIVNDALSKQEDSSDIVNDALSKQEIAMRLPQKDLAKIGTRVLQFADQVFKTECSKPAKQRRTVSDILGAVLPQRENPVHKSVRQMLPRFIASSKKFSDNQNACKASDAQLKVSLQDYTMPTNMLNQESGAPISKLTRSKRRLASREDIPLSKSQLCKRTRSCRLDIVDGKSIKGVCDYCTAWRAGGSVKVEQMYASNITRIEAIDNSFFANWRERVEMLGLQSYELPRSESIEYLEHLIEYLEAVEEDKYNFLVDEKKEELEGLIYFFGLELQEWVDQVKAYSFHLRLLITYFEVLIVKCADAADMLVRLLLPLMLKWPRHAMPLLRLIFPHCANPERCLLLISSHHGVRLAQQKQKNLNSLRQVPMQTIVCLSWYVWMVV